MKLKEWECFAVKKHDIKLNQNSTFGNFNNLKIVRKNLMESMTFKKNLKLNFILGMIVLKNMKQKIRGMEINRRNTFKIYFSLIKR